jgi:hypothetical protein
MLINIKTKTMLEKMKEYQIEDQSNIFGGIEIIHSPECFDMN